jgi:hypothetical protein
LGWTGGTPESILTFGVIVSSLGSARPVEVVEAFTDPVVARQTPIARLGLWAASQEEGGAFVDPLQVRSDVALSAGDPAYPAQAIQG